MRVSAAILAVILGSSAALAQGDPRANPVPVPEASRRQNCKAGAETEAGAKKAEARRSRSRSADKEAMRPLPAKPKSKSATSGSAAAGVAKPSGLQDTYAAIPQADRVAIQNDLTWGGDFTGPIDGEFSERLVAGGEGLPDAAQESGHRRDEPGGAQGARRRRRAAQAARSAGGSPRIR